MAQTHSSKPLVLVADDEPSMRSNIMELLAEEGLDFLEAENGTRALEMANEHQPEIVLVDIKMPGMNGIEVLKAIKKLYPEISVIVFTAFGSNERPIEAMKLGAFDYIEKPFDIEEFLLIIRRALDHHSLVREVRTLRSKVHSEDNNESSAPTKDRLIGSSGKMQEILKIIGKVAPTDTTVLLQGESGTGKELIANAIQRHSNRSEFPFIKVNCGALPEPLLESELFGHEKGAFTGAVKTRLGRFELADKGTIFLDEVNTLPQSTQVKLLRILQNLTFEKVGGETTQKVDVRIVAATNKNLEELVKTGEFREDLYYRLNVLHITVPSLREHPEDIPQLTEHFLKKYRGDHNIMISKEAMNQLMNYHWPGNVRELENVIQRAVVMTMGDIITKNDLPFSMTTISESVTESYLDEDKLPFKNIIQRVEKDLIIEALNRTDGNQTMAAELLDINRRLLYSKIKKYNIQS